MKAHRNLILEHVIAHAERRKAAGKKPLTQWEWMEFVNSKRGASPAIGWSTWARYVNRKRGVCSRVGKDRRFVLAALGIDYGAYLDAWGDGPTGKTPAKRKDTKHKAASHDD